MPTQTQQIQQYADQIYGQGFYKIKYQPFTGFFAVSQRDGTPPHSQFLGASSGHANAHLDSMADIKADADKDIASYSGEFDE